MSGVNPGGQGAGGNDLGSLVTNAIRDVLGWKPDAKDPRGFVKALRRSFEGKEKGDRTEWRLKPRVYAVDADLSGGVSGIQTGLLTRARDVVEKVVPLLDGLESPEPTFSEDAKQILSESIQSNLQELVQEFATPGGPRIPKVEQVFDFLLGEAPSKMQETIANADASIGDHQQQLSLKDISWVKDRNKLPDDNAYILQSDAMKNCVINVKNDFELFVNNIEQFRCYFQIVKNVDYVSNDKIEEAIKAIVAVELNYNNLKSITNDICNHITTIENKINTDVPTAEGAAKNIKQAGETALTAIREVRNSFVTFNKAVDAVKNLNPNQIIGGQIGKLRSEMKLYSAHKAPGIKAETDQANFRILADYIIGLREAWDAEKERIAATCQDMPIGVRLIKISRHLAVLGEAVQEVRSACDGDGLNAGRRLTIELKDSPSKQEITFEALLAWIQEFATADGLRLVEDGGKDFSQEDFNVTVQTLDKWVDMSIPAVAAVASTGATGITAKTSLENLEKELKALMEVVK